MRLFASGTRATVAQNLESIRTRCVENNGMQCAWALRGPVLSFSPSFVRWMPLRVDLRALRAENVMHLVVIGSEMYLCVKPHGRRISVSERN